MVTKTVYIKCLLNIGNENLSIPYAEKFGYTFFKTNKRESFYKKRLLKPFTLEKPVLSDSSLEGVTAWKNSKEMKMWQKKWDRWYTKYQKISGTAKVKIPKGSLVSNIEIVGQQMIFSIFVDEKTYHLYIDIDQFTKLNLDTKHDI